MTSSKMIIKSRLFPAGSQIECFLNYWTTISTAEDIHRTGWEDYWGELEWSWCDSLGGAMPVFVWKIWGNARISSVRITSKYPSWDWTWYLPIANSSPSDLNLGVVWTECQPDIDCPDWSYSRLSSVPRGACRCSTVKYIMTFPPPLFQVHRKRSHSHKQSRR